MTMPTWRPDRLWTTALTSAMVGLIALSVAIIESYLAAVVVVAIVALVAIFRIWFHSSRAFCLTLANLAGIYACVFLFFSETNFQHASAPARAVAFLMPLFAFVIGSFRHRDAVSRVAVSIRIYDKSHLFRIFGWLFPVFAIGAVSFFVPEKLLDVDLADGVLLVAMALISLIVLLVSQDVAAFLLDTGLLFEEFAERVARLIVPAFAFLTCYSLLVIVFATIYALLDHLAGGGNFRIEGVQRAISFPESLYFSLTTLSTVGYGDIAPASNPMRVVAGIEIVCGILLLLFGFNEILSFARAQERSNRPDRSP